MGKEETRCKSIMAASLVCMLTGAHRLLVRSGAKMLPLTSTSDYRLRMYVTS